MRHGKDRPVLRATKTESDFFRGETQGRRETRGSRGAGGSRWREEAQKDAGAVTWQRGGRGRWADGSRGKRGGREVTLRPHGAVGLSRGQGCGMQAHSSRPTSEDNLDGPLSLFFFFNKKINLGRTK